MASTLDASDSEVVIPNAAACAHEWQRPEPMPARWMCACGTMVYRSYEDYCDD